MSQDALLASWRAAWPQALAAWSRFTRLRDAQLCLSRVEAAKQGLQGSFAMIRLLDQSVVVDLETVQAIGLQDYAMEILAHEVGHHVLAPGSATDQFRLLARMRRALPTLEQHAPMLANLFTDLFINDRLQRQAGLRMADIYRLIAAHDQATEPAPGGAKSKPQPPPSAPSASAVWTLYLRIYENLWRLDPGTLGHPTDDAHLQGDAWLGARLIRVYANDWMNGAGRFASLLLPYLVHDLSSQQAMRFLHDTQDAAEGCEPYGAQDIEDNEAEGALHPAYDPRITGTEPSPDPQEGTTQGTPPAPRPQPDAPRSQGQAREPYQYGEILKASGIKLTDHEIAVRYYRERALPFLVPFPVRLIPDAPEPQLEGLEPWEIGDPLDEIDWLQSVSLCPRPIPGLTTVRRMMGWEPGTARLHAPVDLDLYVDSSGSMPNPQYHVSYLTLAGAIVALSALRAGSSVQVTLWSGKNEVMHTEGFVRNDASILRVLTGFYGGGTTFPIHRLRETFRAERDRPTHILMISDDGITTMFDQDEQGNSGWDVSAAALRAGGAGGTMALNIDASWAKGTQTSWLANAYKALQRARDEQGWDIHAVARMEDLVAFARAFAQRHYAARPAQAEPAPHPSQRPGSSPPSSRRLP